MANVPPIDADDFKAYFDRDFPYGTGKCEVRDADISKAIAEANILFNPGLFADLPSQTIAFEYLTAHLLTRHFLATGGIIQQGQGLNSTGNFPISSKGAGGLSVSYAIPETVSADPALAQYLTTQYGLIYLNMVMPNLIGNFNNAAESTKP
jgi:hypothetical protein